MTKPIFESTPKSLYYVLLICTCLMSCTKDIVNKDTSYLNIFQSFWEIMDERYVFFEQKRLDWDSIYTVWHPKFEKIYSNDEALAAFDTIVNCIGDGHVWINSRTNGLASISWDNRSYLSFGKIYLNYGFSNLHQYSNIHTAQLPNSMAYMRILQGLINLGGANGISNYNYSKGLIIDLRDCTGGYETGYEICGLFFNGRKTIYYTQTKQGRGRRDFTDIKPVSLQGLGLIDSTTHIVLLINNKTFSMGNSLAFIIKDITNCTVIGEHTAGGGGSVMSTFLPAGWRLTYTNTRAYDLSKHLIEDGLSPDIEVIRSQQFWNEVHPVTGEDPQLEKAIEVLNNSK